MAAAAAVLEAAKAATMQLLAWGDMELVNRRLLAAKQQPLPHWEGLDAAVRLSCCLPADAWCTLLEHRAEQKGTPEQQQNGTPKQQWQLPAALQSFVRGTPSIEVPKCRS